MNIQENADVAWAGQGLHATVVKYFLVAFMDPAPSPLNVNATRAIVDFSVKIVSIHFEHKNLFPPNLSMTIMQNSLLPR